VIINNTEKTMTSSSSDIKGGCLCGAVRYIVSGVPMYQLICMCEQCQRLGGGFGFGSIVCLKENFFVEKGNDSLKDFIVEGSDKGVVRRFCRNCGTHVTASNATHPVAAVSAGTLDNGELFAPQVAIWCQSKKSFHKLPDNIAEFPQYPPL
jgi:hypothetical protein